MTTTNLQPPRRYRAWRDLPPAVVALICALAILSGAGLVSAVQSVASWHAQQAARPTAQPTPALGYIILGTSVPTPPPTAAPQITPDQHLADELARLQQRVAELEAAQQAQAPAAPPAPAPVVVEAQPPAPPPAAAVEPPHEAPEPPYQVTNASDPPPPPPPAPPAVVPVVPAAPAATPSVVDSAATIAAAGDGAGDRWREEHCFGDVCHP